MLSAVTAPPQYGGLLCHTAWLGEQHRSVPGTMERCHTITDMALAQHVYYKKKNTKKNEKSSINKSVRKQSVITVSCDVIRSLNVLIKHTTHRYGSRKGKHTRHLVTAASLFYYYYYLLQAKLSVRG